MTDREGRDEMLDDITTRRQDMLDDLAEHDTGRTTEMERIAQKMMAKYGDAFERLADL